MLPFIMGGCWGCDGDGPCPKGAIEPKGCPGGNRPLGDIAMGDACGLKPMGIMGIWGGMGMLIGGGPPIGCGGGIIGRVCGGGGRARLGGIFGGRGTEGPATIGGIFAFGVDCADFCLLFCTAPIVPGGNDPLRGEIGG